MQHYYSLVWAEKSVTWVGFEPPTPRLRALYANHLAISARGQQGIYVSNTTSLVCSTATVNGRVALLFLELGPLRNLQIKKTVLHSQPPGSAIRQQQ
jgi:hypothetical protein